MFETLKAIGPMILHEGVGIAIIVACIALELFATEIPIVGPFLVRMRVHLLWVAFVVALCTFVAYPLGVHDERAVCKAQTVVVYKQVQKAVKRATGPQSKRVRDPWDKDWKQ